MSSVEVLKLLWYNGELVAHELWECICEENPFHHMSQKICSVCGNECDEPPIVFPDWESVLEHRLKNGAENLIIKVMNPDEATNLIDWQSEEEASICQLFEDEKRAVQQAAQEREDYDEE